jgi:hypothetical protein
MRFLGYRTRYNRRNEGLELYGGRLFVGLYLNQNLYLKHASKSQDGTVKIMII